MIYFRKIIKVHCELWTYPESNLSYFKQKWQYYNRDNFIAVHVGQWNSKATWVFKVYTKLWKAVRNPRHSLSVSRLLCFVPLLTSFSFTAEWFSLQLHLYGKKTAVPNWSNLKTYFWLTWPWYGNHVLPNHLFPCQRGSVAKVGRIWAYTFGKARGWLYGGQFSQRRSLWAG